MSVENVTIRERILLHLNRFPGYGPEEIYNIPFDLTQDGIASVMGISRAHASLEMKKLRDAGKADEWLAHIKSAGAKRKAYYLLPDGINEAEQLKKRFTEKGLQVDSLLDMKRCDPNAMWENLSIADRETFGLACTFRVPIPRKTIPDTSTGVIPADYDGYITISDVVAKKYLSLGDAEKRKSWHSRAADWWVDNGDDAQERLYHLSNAGRNSDACRLLIKDADAFIDNANEDLLDILKNMRDVPKYAENVYGIRARVALLCLDAEDALKCAERLEEYRSPDAALVRAEVKMMNGDATGAYTDAAGIFADRESPKAALVAAKALLASGDRDGAAQFLESAGKKLSDSGNASYMDDILILKAGIAYGRGRKDECLSYLNKALRACRNDLVKARIKNLIADVGAGKENLRF